MENLAERNCPEHAIRKILVIVDPTVTTHACIEKAARLAVISGSSLELFICDVLQGDHLVLREQRLSMLESLAAPLRARGLRVMTDSEWHAPLEEGIVRRVIRSQADLVVKDTHRHAEISRMSNVQTDWILIRQVPVPLLLVRPGTWPEHPKIAVAVDPFHVAERPVELDEGLISQAELLNADLAGQVEVLHVLRTPPHLPDEMPSREAIAEFEAHQRQTFLRLIEHSTIALDKVHFFRGHPPEGIVDWVVQHKPSLLIMGVAARLRFPNSTATTASQVLEQTDCDVLVLKPPGFISPLMIQ